MEDVEEDVENNLDDIIVHPLKKNTKIVGGKKIPTNVVITPLDNLSFHSKESVLKWKFVYHMRISSEMELSKEAFKCEEIGELVMDAHILEIVSNLSPYYPKLVKEFVVNIPKDFNNAGSRDLRKLCVQGYCFGLSSDIIIEYLGRGKLIIADKVPSLKAITQEITRSVYVD